MRNLQRTGCLVVLMALARLASAAPGMAADPTSPGRSPKDTAVAHAVAEAAAARPEAMPQADPAPATGRGFDRLDTSPRQCSALESAATLAVVATCVRTQHCSTVPVERTPGAKPSCYLFKGTTKG